MCGILCLVNTKFVSHPECLDTEEDSWMCSNSTKIHQICKKELELSKSDMKKLEHQDELRQLHNQLVKLGNNIKQDNLDQIAQVRMQIDSLVGKEETQSPELGSISQQFNYLIADISARGPDFIQYKRFTDKSLNFQLFSSVLSLRQPFALQPVQIGRFVLQFNGELYNSECEFSNDTEFFANEIAHKGITEALRSFNGEYAFTIIDQESQVLYFGRDSIGKRSLCFKHSDDSILVSSVGLDGYSECKSKTLYKVDLQDFSLVEENLTGEFDLLVPLQELQTEYIEKVQQLYRSLKHSCFIRQETIFPLHSTEADLAVLFSGGIDCTIVAALLMENFIELGTSVKIDLLTVGFDNPRTGINARNSPDRELSLKSWFHLTKKYHAKNVSVRLIEIDVEYKQWLMHKQIVEHLMYPQDTEMDLSIAIAFYFASNNILPANKTELVDFNVEWEDFLTDKSAYTHQEEYVSLAKVLFSGLGADELFAGYSRHEALFSSIKPEDNAQACFEELNELLYHDISVIYKRNLGRDDRVISTWGKELRYPYLDKEFIKLVVNEIAPNFKIKLEWTTSKKGKVITKPIRKWILREVAGHMGLDFVQHEIKRAIQFGAKSAKLEIGQAKARGTDSLR